MRSDIAISVKNLTKTYRIFNHPADRIKQALTLGRVHFHQEFTALQDVSFAIKKGESVGIIGRNGSGKSTLLQLVCGILKPTSGEVQVNGRISALLELGSGFNPEFTGRENIYFQGAVMGFSERQMNERIGDIIAFADIGEFIDQPIRTYSSGMSVRLAFAVIAHVDADILIVDEALSVGDAFFTQKCMRFLRNFMRTGTVLFVSHDTNAILNLCNTAILLNKGRVSLVGTPKDVVMTYMQLSQQEAYGNTTNLAAIDANIHSNQENQNNPVVNSTIDNGTSISYFSQLDKSSGWETGKAKILSVRLLNNDGRDIPMLNGSELVNLEIIAVAYKDIYSPILGWFVKDRLGQSLFGEHTYTYVNPPLQVRAGEKIRATFKFKMPLLPNGDYAVTVSIAEGVPLDHTQHHWLHDALILKVSSDKLRYGLVGIPFSEVSLNVVE
jgi:lipopolysaccharide transport system ATP-binding protein